MHGGGPSTCWNAVFSEGEMFIGPSIDLCCLSVLEVCHFLWSFCFQTFVFGSIFYFIYFFAWPKQRTWPHSFFSHSCLNPNQPEMIMTWKEVVKTWSVYNERTRESTANAIRHSIITSTFLSYNIQHNTHPKALKAFWSLHMLGILSHVFLSGSSSLREWLWSLFLSKNELASFWSPPHVKISGYVYTNSWHSPSITGALPGPHQRSASVWNSCKSVSVTALNEQKSVLSFSFRLEVMWTWLQIRTFASETAVLSLLTGLRSVWSLLGHFKQPISPCTLATLYRLLLR